MTCARLLDLVELLAVRRYVSHTSVQNAISVSVGSAVSNSEHHQGGKPCNLAHSVGVSHLTGRCSCTIRG